MGIAWGVKAPERLPKSWIRLLVVKAGMTATLRLLGPAIGVMTHHKDGKSIACVGEGECLIHGLSQEWKGYAPAATWSGLTASSEPNWRLTVAVITVGIAVDVDACRAGTLVEISRPGSNPRGPLTLTVCKKQPIDPVPDTFNVTPYVLRAMGLSQDYACKLKIRRA